MIPWATSVRTIPIWAKPRAAPPPSASPITGRRMLPSPTLSWASETFWPRPIQLSNTQTLLRLQRYSPRRGCARRVRSDPPAWFMPGESGLGRECDWTTTAAITLGARAGSATTADELLPRRLEFAAFSVKSMAMISGGNGIVGFGRGGWPFLALTLALTLAALLPAPVSAQMFSDRPPPVPPAAVPDVQTAPAMNLAPPSGSGAIPPLPAPLNQPAIVPPSIATIPPLTPPTGAAAPNQGVLSLTARYGKDLPAINGGLVWRVVGGQPHGTGTVQPLRPGPRAPPDPRP